MKLAARVADLVFTTQHTIPDAVDFVEGVRSLAEGSGRSRRDVKILPGVTPIIGATESEARELAAELGSFVGEQATLKVLNQTFGGLDLESLDLDEPFPDLRNELPRNASISRPTLLIEIALREGLSVRQLAQRVSLSIGHRTLVGTPDSVADDLQAWFEAGAADGFIILPADLPIGLEQFVDNVIPRLQDRGIFRTAYQGRTLRDHLNEH